MDLETLNEDQRRLLRQARFRDIGAALQGGVSNDRERLIDKFASQRDAEAQRAARQLAVAGWDALNENQKALVQQSGYMPPNSIMGQGGGAATGMDQQAMGNAADAAAPVTPGSVLSPDGGLSPLNTAQQTLLGYNPAGGRPSPEMLNWMRASQVDTAGIAPDWQFQDAYDPASGRQMRVAADRLDPTQTIGIGGVKAPDPEAGTPVKIVRDGQVVWARPSDAYGQPAHVEPRHPRQPTVAEQRYNYLIQQGVDPQRAQGLAYGGIEVGVDSAGRPYELNLAGPNAQTAPGTTVPGVPDGGGQAGQAQSEAAPSPAAQGHVPPKLAQERAEENNQIDLASSRVRDMLASDVWQQGIGVKTAAGRAWNAVGAPFVGGYQKESDQVGVDIATLRQDLIAALKSDKRTTEADVRRIESLLPSGGPFTSTEQARQRLVEIYQWLQQIRSRPLAVDPRGAVMAPQSGDPMSLGNGGTVPTNDPLGLFQ
ncbi:hypothetical protein [Emcibacter sp. SYSU 3D8]|uniref:hypothetical protein n=1 Tax=Emcibacter sp. SYSU 3D8 TaxID=3133969 RepID=UPI0031FE9A8E